MSDWRFKPARDLAMTFRARLRSVNRESSIFSILTRWIWWTLTAIHMRVFHRFRIVGSEHLPQQTPFILVANHSSHLDVISLMLAVPPLVRDRVHPLAAADHFFGEVPMATFTAFAFNALPVQRKGGGKGREDMLALRERLLTDKCGLVLFPEGTRSRTGTMAPFKSGIGMLVAGTDVPVVPCYIEGAYDAFPASAFLPRPKRVRLHVGAPLTFANSPNDRQGCEDVVARLQEAVQALAGAMAQRTI